MCKSHFAQNRLVASGGATLRYDPLGRLYEVSGGSGTTRFLHDGDALIAEYDAAGAMLRRYVHGAAEGVDDPMVWFEGAGMADSARRYLFADERGSIVAVTDANGNAQAINRYDEYGLPDDPGITSKGRFRYTGQAWLPEVGLYYYKARMYSARLGRFMQTDPIGYEDQFNLYGYVANDPVNGTDPTGQYTCVRTSESEVTCTATGLVDATKMGIDIAAHEFGISTSEQIGGAIASTMGDRNSEGVGSSRDVPASDRKVSQSDNGGPPLNNPPRPITAPPPPLLERPIEPPIDNQFHGRPGSNQAQNQQVRDAARAEGLNAEQRRQLGRAVETESRQYGGNLGYHDIRQLAREIKSGRY